ncbi:MAG TPA: zinc-dependent metalloprotease family protein [Saprospiraceae bacterium]|nr:zinc-dependent metalloprotease family protein [Saprospiraceae bacterium]
MRSRWLIIGFLFWVFSLAPIEAQEWVLIQPEDILPIGQRDIIPNVYSTFQINDDQLHDILWSAPHEYAQDVDGSPTLLEIGMPDGSIDIFKIVRYDMMEALLAASYTNIKTFIGVSVSNPYRTLRADYTLDGFRAVIRDENGMMYIDPFQRNDLVHRISYYKKDYTNSSPWDCGVTESEIKADDKPREQLAGDCMFRSYRLAVATTGEYSNYFGAFNSSQSGLVLSQVVTAVNRVNQVYEADLTVRLILIGNTNLVFYYDPAGDPYSGDACNQLNQNQTTINNVIGAANYDVGHVFSVGSGGCAGLGVICSNTNKARGATGSLQPTGDPYYIDYVAHELGHQFGGEHTFNGTADACNGNRVSGSAYEPGSGSTIMAYAGICGAQDLQPHSDPYFHARSLLQIANKVASTSCATFITLNNQAPVAGSPPNYNIPISTPFVLTAQATDPENDPLTYCWEQYDLETQSSEPPAANDNDGPLFRSFNPTTSPDRYFPNITDIVNNVSPMWEVLPSVTRTMTFRMTVRDYHNSAGCTDEDDVVVTSNSNSGPFVVTSQNVVTTWTEGTSQTITWNVANTTASPVSCSTVEIRMSINGGFTYPLVLATNEPNDGSATVVIPACSATNQARIMVKGTNNIFFDINNANITINLGLPTFTLALNPASYTGCNNGSIQTTVQVGQFMGYNNPVTLSISNLPPNATAMFNPVTVIPGSNSTLTISNLTGLTGSYTPLITGTSGMCTASIAFPISLSAPINTGPTLVIPANNAMGVVITPLLDWQPIAAVTQYEYQVAYDNAFTLIAASGTVMADQFQVSSPLLSSTLYYWRVRGINSCTDGPWSAVYNFTTGSCFTVYSTNVPITIPSNGQPTVTSILSNNTGMTINDLDVLNLVGTHSWMDDLQFSLLSPQGTQIMFWNQPCGNDDNFNIKFSDEGAPNNTWPCPPTNGLTYVPDVLLSAFDGQQASGTWTLIIHDVANQDGGVLTGWGLQFCGVLNCQLLVTQTSGSGPGSLPAAINCAMPGDTITISSQLAGQTINIGSNPITISKNLVIKAQSGNPNITGSGSRVFNINNGISLECNALTVTAGTSLTGGAISNTGTLKLKNAVIKKNAMVNGATLVQNNPGGMMNVMGTCNINH